MAIAGVSTAVYRHRTAIGRNRLSLGARAAFEDGVLEGRSVLDYGCGRGTDARHLTSLGVPAHGWDPHYYPDAPLEIRDVVLLTYVLNTIEVENERAQALRAAFDRCTKALVVTARLTADRGRVTGTALNDGILTGRGTFQRLFSTHELVQYIGNVLGAQAVVACPGVAYVFREDRDRFTYLSRRYGLTNPQILDDLPKATAFFETRGRLPNSADGLSLADARSLAPLLRRAADPEKVALGKRQTTLNLLLFLAMERFHGSLPWSALGPVVQADVRTMFGSYKHAQFRAKRLLSQLGDPVILRRTMRASPGKLTPSALYVHRRALTSAPVLLRIYEECGALASGRPPAWDVVKLHHDNSMISWLEYPEFDKEAHPVLLRSHRVNLATLKADQSTYEGSANPPLLHRKEEFIQRVDSRYELYSRLTASEMRAGLYEHPERIGTLEGWQSELLRCGRRVRGHRLVKVV